MILHSSTAEYIVKRISPKTDACGTPQLKSVGLEVAPPVLTVCILPLIYEANQVRGTPQSPVILYRKLHSSLSVPSGGDYQRLLADRCESSAMPSLCCDLSYRLIVLTMVLNVEVIQNKSRA